VGNILIAFYVLTFFSMIFFSLIFLPEFWEFIKEYVHAVAAVGLDLIILYLFKYITMDQNHIKRWRVLQII